VKLDFGSSKPLFLQICDEIEEGIFTGAFGPDSQIPSTTEISAAFHINPATVLKGMNELAANGILYKKRGIGMFVSPDAGERIRKKRRAEFFREYIASLADEAKKLGLRREEVIALVEKGMEGKGL